MLLLPCGIFVLYGVEVKKVTMHEIMNANMTKSIKIPCDTSFKVGRISLDISPLSDNTWQVELIFLQVSQQNAPERRSLIAFRSFNFMPLIHNTHIISSIRIKECTHFGQTPGWGVMFLHPYWANILFKESERDVFGFKLGLFGPEFPYKICNAFTIHSL